MLRSNLLVFCICFFALSATTNAEETPLRELPYFGPRPNYDRSGDELIGQVDCINFLGTWMTAKDGLLPRLSHTERQNYGLTLARVRAARIAHLESVLPGVFRGRFVKQGEKIYFVSYRSAAIQIIPGVDSLSTYGLIADVVAEPGSGLEQAQNDPERDYEITGRASVQHADYCIDSGIMVHIQGTIRATAIRPL